MCGRENPSFAEHPLRKLRKIRGFNQRELARRAGIHYSTVISIESCRNVPRQETVDAIAEVLDVDPHALYSIIMMHQTHSGHTLRA